MSATAEPSVAVEAIFGLAKSLDQLDLASISSTDLDRVVKALSDIHRVLRTEPGRRYSTEWRCSRCDMTVKIRTGETQSVCPGCGDVCLLY